MKLIIGNKNYSTWSLRPWLILDAFSIEFEEINVSLNPEGLGERLGKYSKTKKVPVLIDNGLTVWDSLAICEYVSENYLDGKAWPAKKEDRALARAICSEMHSGFFTLRNEMPMNIRASRKVELNEDLKSEIARIDSIWSEFAKETENGDFRLFGQFSIADCFFAPVALRFKTYGAELLSETARNYMESILKHPSVEKWIALALQETEIISKGERGV